MEYCLNLPSLSSCVLADDVNRSFIKERPLVFVSETEIIHPAGNHIRITKLPSKEGVEKNDSSSNSISDAVFAATERGRGFSLLCYNRRRRLLAYSPRSTSPVIFVRAMKGRKLICEINGAVELEYADLCFNLDGTKVAAIGRGQIDAILYVWSLEREKAGVNRLDDEALPFRSVLMVKHKLQNAMTRCLFNPLNDQQIALLSYNMKSITVCEISKFLDQFKVTGESFELSNIVEDNTTVVTSMVWEDQNKILFGTSCGSIHLASHDFVDVITLSPPDTMKEYGAVVSIIVSCSHIVIGFQNGKISFVNRVRLYAKGTPSFEVETQLRIQDKIWEIACDPLFERFFAFTYSGDIYKALFVDECKSNVSSQPDSVYIEKIASINDCIISSLATLVLTGKASVTLLLSGGCDGKLKVQRDTSSLTNNRPYTLQSTLACLDLGSSITCIETLDGFPVCAVGTSDGCVRFIHIGRTKNNKDFNNINGNLHIDMIVLRSEVLSSTSISTLACATKTKKLVACCHDSVQAFVLCTEPSNLHVLGVVESIDKSPLCYASWCKENQNNLMIGSERGEITCFDISTMCFSPEPIKPLWNCSLDMTIPVRKMAIIDHIQNKMTLIAHGDTKDFVTFEMIPHFNEKPKFCKKKSHQSLSKFCCCLKVINELLMVGSICGEITVYAFEGTRITELAKTKVHCKPILDFTLSQDKSHVHSSSLDGSVYTLFIKKPESIASSAFEYDYLLPKNPRRKRIAIESLDSQLIDKSGRRMTWLCKAKDIMQNEEETKSIGTKNIMRMKVEKLRLKVQELLEENAAADNIEKMDKTELLIDLDEDQKRREKIEYEITEQKQLIQSSNKSGRQKALEFKHNHIQLMQFPYQNIGSISEDQGIVFVPNIPLQCLSKEETRILDMIKIMRCNEMSEMKRNINRTSNNSKAWSSCILNDKKDANYIFDPLLRFKEKKGDDDDVFDTKHGIAYQPHHLLYTTTAIKTTHQRVTQMILLRHSNRDMVAGFNNLHVKLKNIKNAMISTLESAYDRVSIITNNLGCVSTIQKPGRTNDICLERLEIDFYNASQTTGATNEDTTLVKSNFQRGLIDMMDGGVDNVKLYTTKESAVTSKSTENSISDTTQVNKVNHKDIEDNEVDLKQQLFNKLSLELQAIEKDIRTTQANFSHKMIKLQDAYQSVRHELFYNELYQIILLNDELKKQNATHMIMKLNEAKKNQKHKLDNLTNVDLLLIQKEHEQMKLDMAHKLNQDRLLDKKFRREIQKAYRGSIDQETVTLLNEFFLRRDKKKSQVSKRKKKSNHIKVVEAFDSRSPVTRRSRIGRQSGRESSSPIQQPSIDCNIIKEETNIAENLALARHEVQIDKERELDTFFAKNEPFRFNNEIVYNDELISYCEVNADDIPDGFIIPGRIWSLMKQLRKEKIQHELEVKRAKNKLEAMKDLLDSLELEQSAQLGIIKGLDHELKDACRLKSMQSSHILLVLSQGQNELEDNIRSARYHKAAFISSRKIEIGNERLRQFDNEREKIMLKADKLKSTIDKLTRNRKLLQLQENHEKEMYKDVHFMHLSKELKMILNGESCSAKEVKVEDLLLRQKHTYSTKIKKLQLEESTLMKSTHARSVENKQLEIQLQSLRQVVIEKEKVYKSEETFSCKNHELTMKRIIKRSQLLDLAKKNGHEISNLRSELDKLHQKTFPSFPTAS